MSCPLYGMSLVFCDGGAVLVKPPAASNRCPLVTNAFSPCRMEVAGLRPEWTICPRNPSAYETVSLGRWDRLRVLAAIEEASSVPLDANDPLPDTLIAKAQELGLDPLELNLWIYEPAHEWTADALATWAAGLHPRGALQ